jgi:TPR repeat protein
MSGSDRLLSSVQRSHSANVLHQVRIRRLLLLTNKGNALAQCTLAWCYYIGDGVINDHKEAVRLWQLSADQGLPLAQCNLGLCYLNGDHVTKSRSEAERLILSAAGKGCVLAKKMLSTMSLSKEIRWPSIDPLEVKHNEGREALAGSIVSPSRDRDRRHRSPFVRSGQVATSLQLFRAKRNTRQAPRQ